MSEKKAAKFIFSIEFSRERQNEFHSIAAAATVYSQENVEVKIKLLLKFKCLAISEKSAGEVNFTATTKT